MVASEPRCRLADGTGEKWQPRSLALPCLAPKFQAVQSLRFLGVQRLTGIDRGPAMIRVASHHRSHNCPRRPDQRGLSWAFVTEALLILG